MDRLWPAANRERVIGVSEMPVPPFPRPKQVRIFEQLTEALMVRHERAAGSPLRFIELWTDEVGCRVACATAALTVIPSRAQLGARLVCFGLHGRNVAALRAAWVRADACAARKEEAARGAVLCADCDPRAPRRLELRAQHK